MVQSGISYAAGQLLAVVAPRTVLVVDAPTDWSLAGPLWELALDDAPVDEILDVLVRRGIRTAPSFAIVRVERDAVRALVRGSVPVCFERTGEPVRLDATGATTWLEGLISGARRVLVGAVESGTALPYLVSTGVVLISGLALPCAPADWEERTDSDEPPVARADDSDPGQPPADSFFAPATPAPAAAFAPGAREPRVVDLTRTGARPAKALTEAPVARGINGHAPAAFEPKGYPGQGDDPGELQDLKPEPVARFAAPAPAPAPAPASAPSVAPGRQPEPAVQVEPDSSPFAGYDPDDAGTPDPFAPPPPPSARLLAPEPVEPAPVEVDPLDDLLIEPAESGEAPRGPSPADLPNFDPPAVALPIEALRAPEPGPGAEPRRFGAPAGWPPSALLPAGADPDFGSDGDYQSAGPDYGSPEARTDRGGYVGTDDYADSDGEHDSDGYLATDDDADLDSDFDGDFDGAADDHPGQPAQIGATGDEGFAGDDRFADDQPAGSLRPQVSPGYQPGRYPPFAAPDSAEYADPDRQAWIPAAAGQPFAGPAEQESDQAADQAADQESGELPFRVRGQSLRPEQRAPLNNGRLLGAAGAAPMTAREAVEGGRWDERGAPAARSAVQGPAIPSGPTPQPSGSLLLPAFFRGARAARKSPAAEPPVAPMARESQPADAGAPWAPAAVPPASPGAWTPPQRRGFLDRGNDRGAAGPGLLRPATPGAPGHPAGPGHPGGPGDDQGAGPDTPGSGSMAPAPEAPREPPRLLGVWCDAGHVTSPDHEECRVCGLTVPNQAPILVARPPLGVLIFDNGDRVAVDRPVVLGRDPKPVASPDPEAAVLHAVPSATGQVSRTHAEIRASGWDVVLTDLDAMNGTALTLPGASPVAIEPGVPTVITPGARVDLGGETGFVFEVEG